MEDLLIETLETFGYPVMLQGSMLPDEPYPDSFFTFWNNNSSGESYYDDSEISTIFDYDVNFYSSDPELVYSKLNEAIAALRAAGFICSGEGYSLASDEPTHDGRGVNILYLRRNNHV